MMRAGECSELTIHWSAHHTAGRGGSVSRGWPTPTALNNNRPTGSLQEWGGAGGNYFRKTDPDLARARLNPDWVESLMGFPLGWTALTDGPPPQDHNTPGSLPGPDHGSPTTESD